jgi:hypothetical protein
MLLEWVFWQFFCWKGAFAAEKKKQNENEK